MSKEGQTHHSKYIQLSILIMQLNVIIVLQRNLTSLFFTYLKIGLSCLLGYSMSTMLVLSFFYHILEHMDQYYQWQWGLY